MIEVDGGVDYRLRALEQVETCHVPRGAAADAALAARVRSDAQRPGRGSAAARSKAGRSLARRCAGSAVWFDFATLCDGPRSQRDYLELAQRFAVAVPVGHPGDDGGDKGDLARRFTWLVDILYDHRVKLVCVGRRRRAEELYRRRAQRTGISRAR